MTQPVAAPEGLTARLGTRRDAEAARRLRQQAWRDAAASLWSPVLVFALTFLPYILLIELFPTSVAWALPALRAFGLLMLAWWVGLWGLRLVRPKGEHARRLRRDARDLLGALDARLKKTSGTLPKATLELVEAQGTRVEEAMLAGDTPALDTALGALQKTAADKVPGMRRSSTSDFVSGLLKALAVALVIRTVLIEPYRIPSGSMLPTLQIGDQVFINKFIYGVRIPFMNKVPFVIVREPAHGDVVVFENPVTGEDYIKRVVGLPGDVVTLVDGTVHLNGVAQPRHLVDAHAYQMNLEGGEWARQDVRAYEEQLGEHVFTSLQDPEPRCAREGPWTVPAGEVFVMGDNRDASADSRYGLGRGLAICGDASEAAFVPFGNIKGKAMVIWLALGYEGLLSNVFGGTGLRVDRLFLPVR